MDLTDLGAQSALNSATQGGTASKGWRSFRRNLKNENIILKKKSIKQRWHQNPKSLLKELRKITRQNCSLDVMSPGNWTLRHVSGRSASDSGKKMFFRCLQLCKQSGRTDGDVRGGGAPGGLRRSDAGEGWGGLLPFCQMRSRESFSYFGWFQVSRVWILVRTVLQIRFEAQKWHLPWGGARAQGAP